MPIQIVVFDVLGTVLNERASFRAATDTVLAHPSARRLPADFGDQWLDAVNATVSKIACGAERWKPWDRIIAGHLDELAPDLPPNDRESLLTIGHRLQPWPDSAAGLAQIHDSLDTIALSNAGITALMDCSRAGRLTWSTVLSSEMIQTTKPDPRVYAFLLDVLRLPAPDVLFVAAHPWDLNAAAHHGMRTAYLQRPGEGTPAPDDHFNWTGDDLRELAAVLSP